MSPWTRQRLRRRILDHRLSALECLALGAALAVGGLLIAQGVNSNTTPAPESIASPHADAPRPAPYRANLASPQAETPRHAPYRSCAEARAAGAAPVYADQPGYAPWLDRDNDGIGCEPYPH